MEISPRIDTWVSGALFIVAGLATGQLPAPPGMSPDLWKEIAAWSNTIVLYATFLSPIFPMLSSAHPGPLVKKEG